MFLNVCFLAFVSDLERLLRANEIGKNRVTLRSPRSECACSVCRGNAQCSFDAWVSLVATVWQSTCQAWWQESPVRCIHHWQKTPWWSNTESRLNWERIMWTDRGGQKSRDTRCKLDGERKLLYNSIRQNRWGEPCNPHQHWYFKYTVARCFTQNQSLRNKLEINVTFQSAEFRNDVLCCCILLQKLPPRACSVLIGTGTCCTD